MNDQYIIINSDSLVFLADRVNKMIALGYIPCGSIITTKFNYGQPCGFAQPMLKTVNGENNESEN